MVQTDGYLTTDPNGNWLTSNTGSGSGDVSSPTEAGVYARCVHPEAPIAGTKVDANGQVSEGPAIAFTDPGGVLSGAPAAQGDRPYIVWAGVSPLSLKEALIVWNTNITLLNKSGIDGGTITTVTGRLMIIQLDSEVQINGKDKVDILIPPGAVGFYQADGGDDAGCPPENELTTNNGGGNLQDPADPELPCACSEVATGAAGGGGGGGGGNNVDAYVFSTICNPSAQCGEYSGNTARFIVNNAMSFPVRCTYPFYLVKLKTCGCGDCARDAFVWEAAMNLYGGVMPGEIFPLDQLLDIPDPCDIQQLNFSNGYPGSLVSDVGCSQPCPTASVQIVGRWGGTVTRSGRWQNGEPGYAGQMVIWQPECELVCGEPCQATITPDKADCYVPEDIIKPIERTVPVSFFDSWEVTTTTITLATAFESTELTLVTSCLTDTVSFVTAVATDVVVYPTGDGALISTFGTSGVIFPTAFATDVVTVPVGEFDVITAIGSDSCTIVEDITAQTIDVQVNNGGFVDAVQKETFTAFPTALETTTVSILGDEIVGISTAEIRNLDLITGLLYTSLTYVGSVDFDSITVLTGEGALVSQFSSDLITYPTAILTDTAELPASPISAIESVLKLEANLITEIDTTTISYVRPVAGASVVTDLNIAGVTLATVGGEQVLNLITEAVQSVDVLSGPQNFVTGVELGTITYAGPQTGELITAVGAGSVDEVQAVESVVVTLPQGEGALISSFSTLEIVLCSSGTPITAAIIVDLQTVDAGTTVMSLVTALDTQAIDVITSIGTAAVQTLVTEVALAAAEGEITLVTGVTVTAATPQPVTIPQVGSSVATVVQDLGVAPILDYATSNTVVTTGLLDSIELVTDISQTAVATDVITFATELQLTSQELVLNLTTAAANQATIQVVTDTSEANAQVVRDGYFSLQQDMLFSVELTTHVPAAQVIATEVQTTSIALVTDVDTSPGSLSELVYLSGFDTKLIDIVTDIGTTAVETSQVELVTELLTDQVDLVTDLQTATIGTTAIEVATAFNTVDYVLVTSCEALTSEFTLPAETTIATLVIEGSGITLITSTDTSDCTAVPYRFLNHDGQISWTDTVTQDPNCCDTPASCTPTPQGHPTEENCTSFLLLRGNYVNAPAPATRDTCPCYDCSSESCEDDGGGPLEQPGTGPNPCTIRVRRLNRRWCANRHCN